MTTSTLEKVAKWFQQSAPYRQMEKEAVQAREDERAQHAAAIANLRNRQQKELPPLAKSEKAADERVDEAREALRAAERAAAVATQEKRSHSNTLEGQINRHEIALRETADPAIDEFRQEMEALYDSDRHIPATDEEETQYLHGNPVQVVVSTNRAARRERLRAIRDARPKAEELKLEAGVDVAARLQEISDSIPDGNAMRPPA